MSGYYWSVPLSQAEPTPRDLELNQDLLECLKKFSFFESEEESQKREIVLGKLDGIVKSWVKKVTLKKTKDEQIAAEAGGKIFTLGSYRLGVHQQGADIDTLVLGPKYAQREDFFTDLYDILIKQPEVTKITKVTDAYTPIMKLVFSGIEIDLLFATLDLTSIPEDINLSDPNILRNLDEKSVRSLNGPRVADELLHLVPNIDTYRRALCGIKLWAQRRAIYSNILGFLGGIAWALMTARICQFYPNACASIVIHRFFRIYKDWKWPQPVTLKPIEDPTGRFRVWDPKKNVADRKHLMPVITPAYPAMNSTYNVSNSTFQTMKDEILRGSAICDEIEAGTKTWDDLFSKSDFFSRYKHFFEITVSSDTEENQNSWRGFVESKLRLLIQSLESVPLVTAATPFPDGFNREVEVPNPSDPSKPPKKQYQCSFFLGLTIATDQAMKQGPNANKVIDLTNVTTGWIQSLNLFESRKEDMQVDITNLKRSGLPSHVFDSNPNERKIKRKAQGPGSDKKKKTKKKMEIWKINQVLLGIQNNLIPLNLKGSIKEEVPYQIQFRIFRFQGRVKMEMPPQRKKR